MEVNHHHQPWRSSWEMEPHEFIPLVSPTLLRLSALSQDQAGLISAEIILAQSLPRSSRLSLYREQLAAFVSEFAANQAKRLEVANLFDIKQTKSESLKQYLAHFNSAIVQVNNLNQIFFVKAFQKGRRAGLFSDSLGLRKLASIGEIRARAEKHDEAEEDKEDKQQAE
ncbi:hypothetical protein CR513_54200, partial [Mucuna pruriens]